MEIIPVIDLLNGQVVRAQRGERQSYQPIESALCRSSQPLDVAQALLELYPFKTLYIADLDAIQQRGNHLSTISSIRNIYPDINIWVDAGFSSVKCCQPWINQGIIFVVGSESLRDIKDLLEMRSQLGDEQLVLSLDWHGDKPQGPASLFTSSDHWPQRVIIMPLARVGSYSGPDMGNLAKALQTSHNQAIYAAGGVRNSADLLALKTLGVNGALLASTLHDKKISRTELTSLISTQSIKQ